MATGWVNRGSRPPMPDGWEQTRRRILRRDNHLCVKCGAPATDVDHIVNRADHGSNDDANLQSLCRDHHKRKTAKDASVKGHAVLKMMRENKKRPADRHPGLL